MVVQIAQGLLEEGGMPKGITTQYTGGLSNIIIINHEQQNKVNTLKNQSGYRPSFAASPPYQKFNYVRTNNANRPPFKPFNDGSFLKKTNKAVRHMDYEEREDFFYDALEKMAAPIENLEKLFFEKMYPPEAHKDAQNMISSIVNASLADSDPTRYIQDKLTYHKRQYCAAKVIRYVAKFYRVDTFAATEYLRSILLAKHML